MKPKDVDPARILFALQTYFAIVPKLIATLSLALFVEKAEWSLEELARGSDEDLLEDMIWLHRGGPFRKIGLVNAIEPDVFGWFLDGWRAGVRDGVRAVADRLKQYDPRPSRSAPRTRDLLKDLYQGLLPRPVGTPSASTSHPTGSRRDLSGGSDTEATLGSGFWTLLAAPARSWSSRSSGCASGCASPARQTVRPFARLSTRSWASTSTRSQWSPHARTTSSPSARWWARPEGRPGSAGLPGRFHRQPADQGLSAGDRLVLETAAGRFELPLCVDTAKGSRCLRFRGPRPRGGWTAEDYATRAGRACAAKKAERELLAAFFEACAELHTDEVDGIWTRVIRNAFMPAFLEPFDHIVGNPPWVNWESLPASYRERTNPLWRGGWALRPHGDGGDAGRRKKDVAMLMSYVVSDRLLVKNGSLGFVITETVFKTAGAGQGFRRFRYGDGGPDLKVVQVDDMVDLKPFTGAANRTALLVWKRDTRTRYPVGYTVWQRKQRKGIDRHATLDEVDDATRRLPPRGIARACRRLDIGLVDGAEGASARFAEDRRDRRACVRSTCGCVRRAQRGLLAGG